MNKLERKKINDMQREFDKENYLVIDSIGLMSLLLSYNIKPIEFIGDRFKSAVYLREQELDVIVKDWNAGKYDELKLFNKAFAKIKKSFATGNMNDLEMI